MGAPRTSDDGTDVVEGEARLASTDEARVVDAPGRIIVQSASRPASASSPPLRIAAPPARRGGLGLVITVYVLAGTALAAAIYERFWL